MRVLHITPFLQGGAGLAITQLACSRQISFAAVAHNDRSYPGYQNYPQFIEHLGAQRIPTHKINSVFKRSTQANTHAAQTIAKLLVDHRVDIIHTHAGLPSRLALLSRRYGKRAPPIIQTMHGWGTNKTDGQAQQDIDAMNHIDRVVCVSQSGKQLLIGKGLRTSVSVTPYGIPPKPPRQANDDLSKQLLSFRQKGFMVVGMVGSLCPRKGQTLMLQALNRTPALRRSLRCVLFGEGDRTDLLALIDAHQLHDNIMFAGLIPHADRYFANFDALVCTSHSEGLPLSFLEAFRANVPVIAPALPEFEEIPLLNPTQLYTPKDPEALGLCLTQTFAGPQPAPTHSEFVRHYSQHTMEQAYADHYRTLLDLGVCRT